MKNRKEKISKIFNLHLPRTFERNLDNKDFVDFFAGKVFEVIDLNNSNTNV